MRWLLDQGLPRSAAHLLCAQGMDAVHVGDIGMAGASDPEIIAIAALEERIIVTLDADFHALLAKSEATKPSVIRIREEGLKGPALCQLILQLWKQFPADLATGCLLTSSRSQARLRMLPIKL
jgi:predicted nuclease of predicted toxin-antitoxin system